MFDNIVQICKQSSIFIQFITKPWKWYELDERTNNNFVNNVINIIFQPRLEFFLEFSGDQEHFRGHHFQDRLFMFKSLQGNEKKTPSPNFTIPISLQPDLTLFLLGGGQFDPPCSFFYITQTVLVWGGWNFLTFPTYPKPSL